MLSTQDIKRTFGTILDLGAGPGHFARLVESEKAQRVTMADLSCRKILLSGMVPCDNSLCTSEITSSRT